MTSQRTKLLSSVDIPDFDGRVVRSSDEDLLVELQAHDAVSVAFEDLCAAAAIFPGCTNFEAILVDILPRPTFGGEV